MTHTAPLISPTLKAIAQITAVWGGCTGWIAAVMSSLDTGHLAPAFFSGWLATVLVYLGIAITHRRTRRQGKRFAMGGQFDSRVSDSRLSDSRISRYDTRSSNDSRVSRYHSRLNDYADTVPGGHTRSV